MKNTAKFNFCELQIALSGVEFYGFNSGWTTEGVSTDTRTLKKNEIFIALKGINYDAHNLLDEVVKKNASAIIISNDWYLNNQEKAEELKIAKIVVKDTFIALGELASFHRDRFDIPIIAVAGSNGKTTTKELIYCILSQKYNVLKTEHNFNNLIGVSQTLFQLTTINEIAVIEIGTNHPGEIIKLCNILKPTHGLITNIGKEHLEYFHSLEEVETEETFLYGYLLKTGGKAFINYDDNKLKKYEKIIPKTTTFGINKEAIFQVNITFDDILKPTLHFKNFSVNMNAAGLAIGYNAIAAATVANHFDINDNQLNNGLKSFKQEENQFPRMLISQINNVILLNDCYNANPDSMELSLKTLYMLQNVSKKIAIIGDMYELGNHSLEEHKNIIEKANQYADEIILTGNLMLEAYNSRYDNNLKTNEHFYDSFEDIKNYIKQIVKNTEDQIAILVKGSRGMKMENLIELLKNVQY